MQDQASFLCGIFYHRKIRTEGKTNPLVWRKYTAPYLPLIVKTIVCKLVTPTADQLKLHD